MNKYDAIVIGAGHNGLTNAAYLAKAGLDVVLLEKNDFIGGASCTQESHEGWKYSSYSYVCSMMRQAIHRDLDLSGHGLILVPYLGTVNFGDGVYKSLDGGGTWKNMGLESSEHIGMIRIAHRLGRAVYHMLKNQVPFEQERFLRLGT